MQNKKHNKMKVIIILLTLIILIYFLKLYFTNNNINKPNVFYSFFSLDKPYHPSYNFSCGYDNLGNIHCLTNSGDNFRYLIANYGTVINSKKLHLKTPEYGFQIIPILKEKYFIFIDKCLFYNDLNNHVICPQLPIYRSKNRYFTDKSNNYIFFQDKFYRYHLSNGKIVHNYSSNINTYCKAIVCAKISESSITDDIIFRLIPFGEYCNTSNKYFSINNFNNCLLSQYSVVYNNKNNVTSIFFTDSDNNINFIYNLNDTNNQPVPIKMKYEYMKACYDKSKNEYILIGIKYGNYNISFNILTMDADCRTIKQKNFIINIEKYRNDISAIIENFAAPYYENIKVIADNSKIFIYFVAWSNNTDIIEGDRSYSGCNIYQVVINNNSANIRKISDASKPSIGNIINPECWLVDAYQDSGKHKILYCIATHYFKFCHYTLYEATFDNNNI